jgi:hypothetical protein
LDNLKEKIERLENKLGIHERVPDVEEVEEEFNKNTSVYNYSHRSNR